MYIKTFDAAWLGKEVRLTTSALPSVGIVCETRKDADGKVSCGVKGADNVLRWFSASKIAVVEE